MSARAKSATAIVFVLDQMNRLGIAIYVVRSPTWNHGMVFSWAVEVHHCGSVYRTYYSGLPVLASRRVTGDRDCQSWPLCCQSLVRSIFVGAREDVDRSHGVPM